MAATVNIMGPCKLYAGVAGTTEIGESREGFVVRFSVSQREVLTDDGGDVPQEIIYKGTVADITGQLVRYDLANLNDFLIIAGAESDQIAPAVGTDFLSVAGGPPQIVVIKSNKVGGDVYTFPRCVPAPSVEISPIGTNESVVNIAIQAFPNPDSSPQVELYTKTVVPA